MTTATIGGSQVANAIGLGWSSPIRTAGELLGMPGFPPLEDTPILKIGRMMQPVICTATRDAGYPCEEYAVAYSATGKPHYGWEVSDPDRPWLIGHPDGYGYDALDGAVAEFKAQNYPHADLSAQIQTHTYMHLGGYSGGIIATLAGLSLTVTELPRSDETIGRVLALLDRFWQYIEAGELPPPTGHPDDRSALTAAHPTHEPGRKCRETRFVAEARRELAMMNAADGKHGARSRRKNYLAGVITAHMGDAEIMLSATDETVARWTSQTTHRVDGPKIRADHPELAAAYTTTTHSRRLTLT